jgi:hypothetical protein
MCLECISVQPFQLEPYPCPIGHAKRLLIALILLGAIPECIDMTTFPFLDVRQELSNALRIHSLTFCFLERSAVLFSQSAF